MELIKKIKQSETQANEIIEQAKADAAKKAEKGKENRLAATEHRRPNSWKNFSIRASATSSTPKKQCSAKIFPSLMPHPNAQKTSKHLLIGLKRALHS